MRQGMNMRSVKQERPARGAGASAPAAMSRRTMIRTLGAGAAALAVPGLAAGCSSSASGGRTAIRLEETKPEVIPYFDSLVAKFNASQKSISVTHDSASSLIAEFVRGNPPDIDCDNYNLTTSIFVARGVLANLAFSPLKNAPPQKSPLVSGLQQYVSSGRCRPALTRYGTGTRCTTSTPNGGASSTSTTRRGPRSPRPGCTPPGGRGTPAQTGSARPSTSTCSTRTGPPESSCR